jgi:hypothetical protein
MQTYQMQGTPTTILIDRAGNLRKQKFGRDDDMLIGAEIMALVSESAVDLPDQVADSSSGPKSACDDNGCRIA